MKILRARIYKWSVRKKIWSVLRRKGQVGTGDRSEKIRTYNYPKAAYQIIGLTASYNLEEFVNEGKLDEVIEELIADDNMKKLAKDGMIYFC